MEKKDNELLGSFALNALSDAEREEVLRQGGTLDPARRDIDSLRQTAAYLSLGTPEIQPPARLKANIMDAIRTVPQLPAETEDQQPHEQPQEQEGGRQPESSPLASGAGEQALPPQLPGGRRGQKFFALAAGVLLIAAGGLGAMAWNLHTQQDELEARMQAMSSERYDMMQILGAPDMQSKSQTLQDGATIRLSYSAESGLMAVSTTGMPELPEDKGYEMWLISADGATPAGMLDMSDPSGMNMVAGSMGGVTHFGITVEPAAGSAAPTTEPIMLQGL